MRINDFSLQPVDERMYVIFSNQEVLLVDPFVQEELIQRLEERAIKQILILLTHEHFDHITGVNYYHQHYKAHVICSKDCAIGIQDIRKNLSARFELFYLMNPAYDRNEYKKMCSEPFTCMADEVFETNLSYEWEEHQIEMYATPGHSPGSSCILIDKKHLFTGDSLVNGFEVITRYPGGSRKQYENYVIPFLKKMGKDVIVYPGHGDRAPLTDWSF